MFKLREEYRSKRLDRFNKVIEQLEDLHLIHPDGGDRLGDIRSLVLI